MISLLGYSGQFAKVLVAMFIALALGIWPRRQAHSQYLASQLTRHRLMPLLVAQLLSFGIFFWITGNIFAHYEQPPEPLLAMAWIAFAAITFLTWMLSFAPIGFWLEFIKTEKITLCCATAVGIFSWIISQQSQSLWVPLSDYTFTLAAALLELFYTDTIVDVDRKDLGTIEFLVNIAPACSGYEGIGLVTLFTGFYLALYRQDFRFPQVLLLFPIGIISIWLLNVVRIVVLIAIGSSISPDIAMGGFHSQAGWITFILAAIGLLSLAHKVTYFNYQQPSSKTTNLSKTDSIEKGSTSIPIATLVPAVTLLAATLVTAAMSAEFDWTYPLRVIATAIAIAYCWKTLAISDYRPGIEPILFGFLVFIIWILMIPIDPEYDLKFGQTLSDSPAALSIAWLLFRSIGAIVTVPIAEELAFRAYLLSRLCSDKISLQRAPHFSWVAMLVSSVVFGALHSAWIAGTLAGIIYAIARYRGQHIGGAITAHLITNLLLTLYVFATGHWSAW